VRRDPGWAIEVKLQDYLVLLFLAAIWGASFMFIKIAVGEMTPVDLVFGRTLSAAIGLLAVIAISRISMASLRRHWRAGIVIALFNSALPYTLIAFGEKYIDSSLAGILNATAPLWTAVLAPFWAEADKLGWPQLTGLSLGFVGIVILAHPTANVFNSNTVGILAVVGATLCYAWASHFSKRAFQETPPQIPAFLQCILSAVLLLPLAIAFHPAQVPSAGAIAAVVWLGLGATGLAMVLAFHLIKRVGASRTIVVTYLIPPFALLWGIGILHEHIGVEVIIALVLILSGVFLITRPGRSRVQRIAVDEAMVEV
jgi:drug/metabolite transporter (DMT)-like permease